MARPIQITPKMIADGVELMAPQIEGLAPAISMMELEILVCRALQGSLAKHIASGRVLWRTESFLYQREDRKRQP